jgi:MFS family permease
VLVVLLFFCGITSTAASTGTNRFLALRVPVVQQGLAFGIKQAAVPVASLVGGLAVPVIALTIGWRWAFAFGAALALATYLAAPAPSESLAHQRSRGLSRGDKPIAVLPLSLVGAGLGLGTFAASGLNAFLVTAGVTIGLGQRTAGLTAAAAAAAAITLRVGMGRRVDRRGSEPFRPVVVLMTIGVAGYALLAASPSLHWRWLFAGGAILAAGAGWGWNGLLNLGVTRSHLHAPARATSVIQVGGRLGGLTGPYAFGLVAERASYTAAWLIAACALLAATGAVFVGRRMLISRRQRHQGLPVLSPISTTSPDRHREGCRTRQGAEDVIRRRRRI